jgi:transcriptional regulator with XRE-family HTH domain
MKFGEFLRNLRDKQHWTQPEAAKKIDIEQSYLSKLETGKSYPSEDIFDRLVEIYDIDVRDLHQKIVSSELEKLKEIKQVRNVILSHDQAKTSSNQRWLVMGLVMLVFGAGALALAILPTEAPAEYVYRSQGIVLPGEELSVFDGIDSTTPIERKQASPEQLANRKSMLARIEQDDKTVDQYKGDAFIENVLKGKRYYKLLRKSEGQRDYSNRWFMMPALMFILGSFGCFYIARRWK